MVDKFQRLNNASQGVHFGQALMGEPEHSRMDAEPIHITTFNAGDIVPIYCREILPDQGLSLGVDFVIRQTTLLTPTMGNMHVDIYAFFVPNRIVNRSFKAVQGENMSGSWVAENVSLVPLVDSAIGSVQVPVDSVADYYGFPTQQPIPKSVLIRCHDLKFRGYVMIYNEFFRDQNYQPPISFSTLNVYNGFFENVDSPITLDPSGATQFRQGRNDSSGAVGQSAVVEAVFGQGDPILNVNSSNNNELPGRIVAWSALGKPFKANKLHDYFTSVLPSPQKAFESVLIPASGSINSLNVITDNGRSGMGNVQGSYPGLIFRSSDGTPLAGDRFVSLSQAFPGSPYNTLVQNGFMSNVPTSSNGAIYPSNLVTEPGAVTGLSVDVNDIRMASAIQQVYEIFARGGTRYREFVSSFFGISADDPFSDIPQCLGHISRDLDLYQTAQTSASSEGSTPQGNLSAFGYTAKGGSLFNHRFVEHGYVHVFAVVRHRNLYSSFLSRDNFRLNSLDFYLPPLANISEQPVYTREINPFAPNPNSAFGYQEAWAEYRYEPDQVSGYMRTMPDGSNSLSVWNYADSFDSSLQIADADFIRSNSEEVLNRTLAVTSAVAPQFKGSFLFTVDKDLPMPTYSVPGMDII